MAEIDDKASMFIMAALKSGYSRDEINQVLSKRGMSIPPELPEGVYPEAGLISEIPGLSPALVHGTTPLAEAVGETAPIPEQVRNPLSGLIGIAPEIAAAFAAPKAAKTIAGIGGDIASGIGSKLSAARKVLTARSPKEIGTQIEDVEKLGKARLPGLKEPLVKVSRTPDGARVEIDNIATTLSKKQSARKLLQSKKKLDLILTKFTKNQNRKDNLGEDAVAKASRVQDQITMMLHKKLPARAPLAEEYSSAMKRKDLIKGALKMTGLGAGAATGLGALGYIGSKLAGRQ